jgi:hypothetical protein
VLLIAMPVGAQGLVQFEFAGTVTDTSGNLGIFGPFGTVQLNDVFTGRFSYLAGPGNPDQEPGDPNLGVYQLVDFELDQAVVPITPFAIGVTHQPWLPTLPPLPADLGTDGFAVAGTFMAGQDPKVVTLRLEAPYEAVLNDDSLPTSLTLSDFTDSRVVRSIRVLGLPPSGMSQIDEGQLTSLVQIPEPSSAALLLFALVAVGLATGVYGGRLSSQWKLPNSPCVGSTRRRH